MPNGKVTDIFLGLLEGITFLRNVGKCFLFDTASDPRRIETYPALFIEIYKVIFTHLSSKERLLLGITQYECMAEEKDSGIIYLLLTG
jgi:hypothetical protein